ncbi:hypothetical protein BMETH_1961_0 [methanotrophic bacterial endosymbiont of Bathymodiolus sp.]|nr:hypothetical protein BMETH_1961_0 [methanotrophic bacterial endosymbiont of Bathymodiolus sp.]
MQVFWKNQKPDPISCSLLESGWIYGWILVIVRLEPNWLCIACLLQAQCLQ